MVRTAHLEGRSVMAHSDAISRGLAARVAHMKLDPKRKNRAGIIIRESRDNDQHPASTPIAVFFDTTGSMGHIPALLVEKLGSLMKLLVDRKYVTDPQLLFGAINDAGSRSEVPLEVGQFESSNEMDDVVTKIWSGQSGGGGGLNESYELAFYYMARYAALDSLEKRNKKGYFFIIGDEMPYDSVSPDEVLEFVGDTIQEISTVDILTELRAKFEVFWILPNTSTARSPEVNQKLTELFGQNLIRMSNAEQVCETIAATIAIQEGRDPREVIKDLKDHGASDATAQAVADAIPPRNITVGEL